MRSPFHNLVQLLRSAVDVIDLSHCSGHWIWSRYDWGLVLEFAPKGTATMTWQLPTACVIRPRNPTTIRQGVSIDIYLWLYLTYTLTQLYIFVWDIYISMHYIYYNISSSDLSHSISECLCLHVHLHLPYTYTNAYVIAETFSWSNNLQISDDILLGRFRNFARTRIFQQQLGLTA